ncbi:MAG: bifunctional UDP-N-acetylglucosamine diphosphorylase/glucosamine-1-phosphate N-acetyltransferase GlmU [Actinobacteria bacterium]|nr:bifunctional UDP-N-acetylglucosamine diphosphorylase/glucosamine-1-phosphate N-acetyltransferase GlmU [Actinomycetota bacterium]
MTTRPDLAVVILAAGKGTRFKSDLAKVLHRAAGRSMLHHVLEAVRPLGAGQVVVVVGHQAEEVEAEARTADLPGITFALQKEQLGTGHATRVAVDSLGDAAQHVLVLPGDTPLLGSATLTSLVESALDGAALLTATVDDPTGYGRIVRDGDDVARVVEQDDATDEELTITEVNGGVYAFRRSLLAESLAGLGTDNVQSEMYLTDVIEVVATRGVRVTAHAAAPDEVAGVNDRRQLADAAAVLRGRVLDRLMSEGVTVLDPDTTYVDVDVKVGADTVLYPNCILEDATEIGERATVGPNCHLVAAEVGDEAHVTNAVVKHAVVGPEATVGPFTYLRPGTVLDRGAKAGGFVEIKKSRLAEGAKVPHLSYIGDATIGRDANIGAGTITCNFDGFDKHETTVGDGAFVGSDTMLVAPIEIGAGAVTGAGSVITSDVPADALALERSEQQTVTGWAAKRREARSQGDA